MTWHRHGIMAYNRPSSPYSGAAFSGGINEVK